MFVFFVYDNNTIIKLHVNYSTLLYNKESVPGKIGYNKMPKQTETNVNYLSLLRPLPFFFLHYVTRVGAFSFGFQLGIKCVSSTI